MVKTSEMARNKSKEGKQGENMDVPELEHSRLEMVKNQSSDRHVVRQAREALTAPRNDANTKERHTGEV